MKNRHLFRNYKRDFKKFKNKNITMHFMVFSSNKFVEFLILKLNKIFFNSRAEKKYNKNYKNMNFCISTNISNYIMLKKYINFELNREKLKFVFLCININNNKLSVSFFENNFLEKILKEDLVHDLVFLNYMTFIVNYSLFIKLFMFVYYLLFNQLNFIKYIIIKSLN